MQAEQKSIQRRTMKVTSRVGQRSNLRGRALSPKVV